MLSEHRTCQRGLYQRWLSLADQRLAHLAELYETGRWRRYHNQTQFLENVRESRAAVQMWQRMLDQLEGRNPTEQRPLQLADITATDLVLPRGVHMLPASAAENGGAANDIPAALRRNDGVSKTSVRIELSAASLMPEIAAVPEPGLVAGDAVEPVTVQLDETPQDSPPISHWFADAGSVQGAESDAALLVAFLPDQIVAEAPVEVEPQAKSTVGTKADEAVSLIDWTQHHGILIQQRYPILRHV